jgi:ketosteroid isomerase-like protein
MSEDDLQLLRDFFERRERGDYAAEFLDPDVEYKQVGPIPDFPGEWHGVEQVRAVTVDFLKAWEDIRYEVERLVDLCDRVLVLERQRARGKGSGVHVPHELAHFLTVRNGKIVRWEAYWDPSEAMRLAGLEGR